MEVGKKKGPNKSSCQARGGVREELLYLALEAQAHTAIVVDLVEENHDFAVIEAVEIAAGAATGKDRLGQQVGKTVLIGMDLPLSPEKLCLGCVTLEFDIFQCNHPLID